MSKTPWMPPGQVVTTLERDETTRSIAATSTHSYKDKERRGTLCAGDRTWNPLSYKGQGPMERESSAETARPIAID